MKNRIILKTISFVLAIIVTMMSLPLLVFAEELGLEELVTGDENGADVLGSAPQSEHTDTSTAPSYPAIDVPTYEVVELREESVKHFRLSDGSYVAAEYGYPVHYTNADGQLTDIDNSLGGDGAGSFENPNARIKFVKKITGNSTVFTLKDGNTKLEMSLVGAIKGTEGEVTNYADAEDDTELQKMMSLEKLSSKVTYADILDGVDLEYIAESLNVKENLIVKQRLDDYSFTFEMKLNGLSAALSEGDVVLSDDAGEIKYFIPAPYVFDAAGESAPSSLAYYTLVSKGNKKYTLTVTVDEAWMNAEDRAYPVTVDPAITVPYDSSFLDTFIKENDYASNYYNHEGLLIGDIYDSYIKFSLDSITGLPEVSSLSQVTLNLFSRDGAAYVGAYKVSSNWDNSLTWSQHINNNAGTISNEIIDYVEVSESGKYYTWDITSAVYDWMDGDANYGLALSIVPGTTPTGTARFYSSDSQGYPLPTIAIYYTMQVGLESYWSYNSQTVNGVGAGNINLATGSLVFALATVSATDGLFGYTPSLVYNSVIADKEWTSDNVNTPYTDSYMPKGFKLSINQTLRRFVYSAAGYEEYIYIDADGTEHSFYIPEQISESYSDSDGLGLKMELSKPYQPDYITITDAGDNVLTFEAMDYTYNDFCLTTITDVAGNSLVIDYKDTVSSGAMKYLPISISLIPNGSTKITYLNLHYNTSSKLSCIVNVFTREAVFFRYSDTANGSIVENGKNYLREIHHAFIDDGFTYSDLLNYYNSPDTAAKINVVSKGIIRYDSSNPGKISYVKNETTGEQITYVYNKGKAYVLSEVYNNTMGQSIIVNYGRGYTDVRSSGKDDTLNNQDDIITRYIFDKFGRTTSAYSYFFINGEVIGAQSGAYSEAAASKNSISRQVVINSVENADNLLAGNTFDDSTMLSEWDKSDSRISIVADGQYANFGGSVKMTSDYFTTTRISQRIVENAVPSNVYESNIGVEYAISGFGKAVNLSGSSSSLFGIRVEIGYYTENDGVISILSESRTFGFSTNTSGWQYIGASFNTEPDENGDCKYLSYVAYIDVIFELSNHPLGYALFDGVQCYVLNDGQYVDYDYNENGDLTRYVSGDYREYWTYDDENRLLTSATSTGKYVEYFYLDEERNIITEIKESVYTGTYISWADDPTSGFDSCTLKSTTVYTYDLNDGIGNKGFGLLIAEKVFAGDTTADFVGSTYTYYTSAGSPIFGTLKSVIDSFGHMTRYLYDESTGKLISTVNTTTLTGVCYSYDSVGRLVGVTPAQYNSATSTVTPQTDSEFVEFEYNESHELTKIITDTTEYVLDYDGYGNQKQISVGEQTLVSYKYYTSNGKPWKVIYGNGLTVEYVYNTLELLSEIWYAYSNGVKTKVYSYEYTDNGQLKKYTDHRTGKSVAYVYDSANRLTEVLESGTDNNVKLGISAEYDNLSRLSSLDYSLSGLNVSQSYTYRYDGAVSTEGITTDNTSGTIRYTYDNLGRIASKVNNQAPENSTARFRNTVTYAYAKQSNATSGLVSVYTSTINGISTTYSYTYDSRGYITKIEISDGTVIEYEYDDVGQLTRETDYKSGKRYLYVYDDAGNILTKAIFLWNASTQDFDVVPNDYTFFSYDSTSAWGDLLTRTTHNTSVGTVYDAIGNPTTFNGFNLVWDGRRLIQASKTSTAMSFTYNDEGLRTSKTVNGVTTNYYYDSGMLVAEETAGSITMYMYDAYGSPIGFTYHDSAYASGVVDTYWYDRNLQGDIVAVYDASGVKLISYKYDAWGSVSTYYHNGGGATSAVKNSLRYRGYYFDTDLGFYYLQSRYYCPTVSRFISPDDVSYLGANGDLISFNLYAYCNNDPVNKYDPTGHSAIALLIAFGIGAVLGGIYGGVSAAANGQNVWKGIAIGAVVGGLTGLITEVASVPLMLLGTFAVGAGGDIASQMILDEKSFGEVNLVSAAWAGVANAGLALVGKGLSIVDKMAGLTTAESIIFGTMTNSPLLGLGMAINMGISKHAPVYTVNDLYNDTFGKYRQLTWRW